MISSETCAENLSKEWKRACVSKLDASILNKEIAFYGHATNRTGCMCPRNKHELLDNPYRCQHKCLYCFWQDADSSDE